MIKKVCKSLKQTNYGKKIYDNLMSNYGEYFNNINPGKSSRTVKKPVNQNQNQNQSKKANTSTTINKQVNDT